MRLALIYTTFPKGSETFLQREAKAFLKAGAKVEFYSIWGGKREFEGRRVRNLGVGGIAWAVVKGIGLLFSRPQVWGLLRRPRNTGGWLGLWENYAGVAAGVVWAKELAKADWVHAQWGGAPAMAALAAEKVAKETPGVRSFRYSMGLHAYDLWEEGGDAWMEAKVARAAAVFSSNDAAHAEVKKRFPDKKAWRVRRGLPAESLRPLGGKARRAKPLLLGIGRLIEKKGFEDFVAVCAELRQRGVDFEAEIIGEGPLREALQGQIGRRGLGDCVRLAGWKSEAQVRARLEEATLLLFTGRVAKSGDRDGFPNTLGEAFAAGAVVVAHDVAGVAEGVVDGQTGILMRSMASEDWASALEALLNDAPRYERLRQGAHAWVAENFDAEKNAQTSLETFEKLQP